jgi:transcription antitermination factor NusA-like protein
VKAEICQFCLRSGILCSKCKAKLSRGEITPLDLEIARLLVSIENKYPMLQDVYFHRAVEANGLLAIFVRKGDSNKILSYGGKIIKFLENKTGKDIRILEYNTDERKFLEDLFAPLSVLTVNKIWLPDGSIETRVILKGRSGRRGLANIDALKEIAKKVKGTTLRIEFAD